MHSFQINCAYNPPKKYKGSCLDGRDITYNIIPDADFKFFITANLKTRALRRYKELKAKKHHEKLSLLGASVKEIVHREKMEPQYVILFGSYARGDFNGFSDVDLIVVDHNRDQADRLACSIQEQGLADDVLTLNSEEWNQKKKSNSFFWKSILQESICLYEHS